MKCVCGYEYRIDFPLTRQDRTVIGDEEFIRVLGTFLKEGSGWERNKIEVALYACPKCKTIQMLDW
jgi:hypothetical protein